MSGSLYYREGGSARGEFHFLIDGIQRELVQSLMRGDSLVKTRDHIAQRFGVSKYKAGRLAHTEATYFNAVSTQACYEDLGVEKIEILEVPKGRIAPGDSVRLNPTVRGTVGPLRGRERSPAGRSCSVVP